MKTYSQNQIDQMIQTALQERLANQTNKDNLITEYTPQGRLERVLHKISNLLGL